MRIKNSNLLSAVHPLQELLKQDLPVSVGWPITKAVKKLNENIATFHEYRSKIVEKYCKKDDNGKPITKDGQYVFECEMTEMNAEIKQLLDQESEVAIDPVSVAAFGDVKIPPQILLSAEFLFKD